MGKLNRFGRRTSIRIFAALAALEASMVFAVGLPTPALASTLNCTQTSTGHVALTDLGPNTYLGEVGGLYPGGSNIPPAGYRAAGIQAAGSIGPIDRSGRASASGRVVLLSIGMSNATQEFSYFAKSELSDSLRSADVAMLDGAQGGAVAKAWTSPTATTWTVVEQRLTQFGYTDQQVEAIWLKEVDGSPKVDFETYAHGLQAELGQIIQIAAQRFPNLRQVFVSPRTYGGYSLDGPNPEPYAYETGFADKFLIAQSIANPTARPWVGWGPYLWTDGIVGRADGLKWYCSDTIDGTHPSISGRAKVNTLMHSLFTGSAFTSWFGTGGGSVPPPTASPVPTPAGASPTAGQATATPGAVQHSAAPGGGSTAGSPTSNGVGVSPPAVIIRSALSTASRNWPLTIGVILLVVAAGITAVSSVLGRRRRRVRPAVVMRPQPPGGANGTHHAQAPPGASPSAGEPPVLIGSKHGGDAGKPPTP